MGDEGVMRERWRKGEGVMEIGMGSRNLLAREYRRKKQTRNLFYINDSVGFLNSKCKSAVQNA